MTADYCRGAMDFPSLKTVGSYISLTALRDNTEDPNPFHINMPHLTEIHGQSSNRAIYIYDVDATVIDLSGLERTTSGGITISTNDYVQELRLDDNGLTAAADDFAPLFMLRGLRILSMERNQLTAIPQLIGTALSLRRLCLVPRGQLVPLRIEPPPASAVPVKSAAGGGSRLYIC